MKLTLFLLMFSLVACDLPKAPEPESVAVTHGGYAVTRLFTHDGCTIYRFDDGGYHYWAVCPGRAASASEEHRRQVGKTSRVDVEEVPTLEVAK